MKVKRKGKLVSKGIRRKHVVKRIIGYATDHKNIYKITPQIHRFCLSGSYIYEALEKKIGKLYILHNIVINKKDSKQPPVIIKHSCDGKKKKMKRMPVYNTQAIRQLSDGSKITVFVNPNTFGVPPCYLEYSYPTKEFLIWLDNKLPELKVSKAEYAIDCYCIDNEFFFDVVRTHLYISYGKNTKLNHMERGRMNRLYRINPSIKLYERGQDKMKKGKGWYRKDIEKVRLENTCKHRILKEFGIGDLSEFIKHPHFFYLNYDKFKFFKFSNSKKLPRYWEGYNAKDEKGHQGAFQQQLISERKIGKVLNLNQYKENIKEFNRFTRKIHAAMKSFDASWGNDIGGDL